MTPPASSAPSPLRVAILGESYLPYLSGVTVATEALARGLTAAGHRVLLVVPRPARGQDLGTAGAQGPDPQLAWLPSMQLPPPAPGGYRIPWPVPSAALRTAATFRPQLVHAQSPFVSGILARRLARRVGAPLVFTHHTRFGDYSHYAGPLARPVRWLLRTWLRAWWRACDAIVAPGSHIAAEIRADLGPGGPPVWHVPTGLDCEAIAALPEGHPRRESGWPMDSLVVVSLGRLALEKSVDVALDAFAAAARDVPRLRLLFVGGGPASTMIADRAARLGCADKVRVTGRMPRPDALCLVRASDLFLFASRTETQGLVLGEALAAGVPVVALRGPGTGDSVRDGVDGRIVDGADRSQQVAALAEALRALATDDAARAAMAAAAREGAARFSSPTRIQELVSHYRELLSSRNGAA